MNLSSSWSLSTIIIGRQFPFSRQTANEKKTLTIKLPKIKVYVNGIYKILPLWNTHVYQSLKKKPA